jgi:hypothetical protein
MPIHYKPTQLLSALKLHLFVCFLVLTSVYLHIVGVKVTVATDHTMTHTHTHFGRTPLDEGSARRRDFTWQHTTVTRGRLHVPGGIRTRTPSN